MINIVRLLWIIFQAIIAFNLVFPMILNLIYFVSRKRPVLLDKVSKEADYAIIVTAYEQTELLSTVVESLLNLNYKNYIIYIVADKCNVSNLNFNNTKVILLKPEEVLASNTKSHFYAIKRFIRNHERLTIIDSDNLVHPEYLNELNKYFNQGFTAVQGIREAKNLDTMYACLDAARDIYYHFYDGKVLFAIGSSATLAGSGMAFNVLLYKQCLEHLNIAGAGFDKILQYEIVRRGNRIAFCEKAIVYDEKTSKSDQLVNQRARWINTWFKYFGYGFKLINIGISKLNWNQVVFGIVLLRPPLFIFLLLSVGCLIVNSWLSSIGVISWAVCISLFIAGFFISLLNYNTNSRIYRSILSIPKFMFFQIISLIHVKAANKKSVATRHYHSLDVTDVKKNN